MKRSSKLLLAAFVFDVIGYLGMIPDPSWGVLVLSSFTISIILLVFCGVYWVAEHKENREQGCSGPMSSDNDLIG
jgi:hypothetical protein